jgi:hypothetical protein
LGGKYGKGGEEKENVKKRIKTKDKMKLKLKGKINAKGGKIKPKRVDEV